MRRIRHNSTMTQNKTFENFYGYLTCLLDMLIFLDEHNIKQTEALDDYLLKFKQNMIKLFNDLPESEKIKIDNIESSKYYIFKLFIQPYIDLTIKETEYKKEINSLKGQLNWHKNENLILKSKCKNEKMNIFKSIKKFLNKE